MYFPSISKCPNTFQKPWLHVHVHTHAQQDGETPLLCACWHGYPGVVKCLVKLAFSSMETVNNEGESPLHVAAVRGYDAIVRFLCKSGARLNVVDNVRVCV